VAVSHSKTTTADDIDATGSRGGSEVGFEIGDQVRDGTHVGTVTDVGTVLVHMTTTDGASRVACPWELVRIRSSHQGLDPYSRQREITTYTA
jgi:hypothetical protein